MSQVREQYERFPYPPIPRFATPRPGEGEGLRYPGEARGIRILVAGAGTFEAAVVAQANPRAREVLALDVSGRSLSRLRTRVAVIRASRGLTPWRGRIAPVRTVRADLREWSDPESFDYIVATHVLHHLPDPAGGLASLAKLLRPGGLLRLTTYPKASRIWMRAASQWLKLGGLSASTPGLRPLAVRRISELPEAHPVRAVFRSHPETSTLTGLVDAFFHSLENPLGPLEWERAAARADLVWAGARGDVDAPEWPSLSPWERLQVLDDLLDLWSNPTYWLRKGATAGAAAEVPSLTPIPWPAPIVAPGDVECVSDVFAEIGAGLCRARSLLARSGVSLEDATASLRQSHDPSEPALSILGRDLRELETLAEKPRPDWRRLARRDPASRLSAEGIDTPAGLTLEEQASYLAIRVGCLMPRYRARLSSSDPSIT